MTDGFVGAHEVGAFVGHQTDAEFLICGPTGFMDVVETALHGADVDPARIHVERFTPASANAAPIHAAPRDDVPGQTSVTITVGTRTETIEQRGSSTILQSARWAGLPAPSSCEAGHCATCMARVLEGAVEMANNEVLTQDEVDEGWVLTCQAVPVSRTVRVVYE